MFEEIRNQFFPAELPGGVIAKPVDIPAYERAEAQVLDRIFPSGGVSTWYEVPPERREKAKPLFDIFRQVHKEFFVLYKDDAPIGLFEGRMDYATRFLMDVSGVLPEYRRSGVYSAFVTVLLDYLRELGYERVISYHSPTNRAVLAAKLKLGFNVTGTLFREDIGASVMLTCFLHDDRFESFQQNMSLEPDFTRQP